MPFPDSKYPHDQRVVKAAPELLKTHTPGPWRFAQDGHEPYWNVDMPFTDGSGRYGAYNAMVYTTEADARLIASAPELLVALKDLMTLYKQGQLVVEGEVDEGDDPVIGAAMSAIAKAEGRSE